MHRPWGSYQSVDNGERHQVKRIIVKPVGRLSLQKHHHTLSTGSWCGAPHRSPSTSWSRPSRDKSIYIPIGCGASPQPIRGKIDLELIEVQTGSYLGEDDIVRFEDAYNRG